MAVVLDWLNLFSVDFIVVLFIEVHYICGQAIEFVLFVRARSVVEAVASWLI